jgi:hypothetical protein
MLTSIVLSMTLAAPVPVAPPAPAQSGPLPRLMEVKANADGKVMVTIVRMEKQKIQIGAGGAVGPNGAPPAVITREVQVPKIVTVDISEVKELAITTADGKKVDVADATKKLKDGAVVVVSADGKPVSPAHLKLFKDDVLVFVSPELINNPVGNVMPGRPGGIRPLPAPLPPQVLPALPPGGIQIQPGVIQVVPALPAVPPQPAPAPAPEK